MKLTATVTDNTATRMTISGASSDNINTTFGGAALHTDVRVLASADTSVSVSIADGTEEIFALASGDYTSATVSQQKNESNSNFKKLVGHGPWTVTVSGISSGNVRVDLDLIPIK